MPCSPHAPAPSATAATAIASRRELTRRGMAAASIRNNAARDRRVTAVHIALGVAGVAVNLAAGACGAWAWWQWRDAPGFWSLLRTGQALVAVEAALGCGLQIAGKGMAQRSVV